MRMNKRLPILAPLLLPVVAFAQEKVSVKGRIINKRGEAVEYVQVGVPKLHVGTISTADERFEPGKYFVAFQIVSIDKEAARTLPESERSPFAMHLYTPLHLKSSYRRDAALGEFKHVPVNIGMAVKRLK